MRAGAGNANAVVASIPGGAREYVFARGGIEWMLTTDDRVTNVVSAGVGIVAVHFRNSDASRLLGITVLRMLVARARVAVIWRTDVVIDASNIAGDIPARLPIGGTVVAGAMHSVITMGRGGDLSAKPIDRVACPVDALRSGFTK